MPKTERLKAKMAAQRRIPIEELCDNITDPVLKQGMVNLLEFLHSLKMKPTWYHSVSYKCHYKKEPVAYITVQPNKCHISVATISSKDNSCRNDISGYANTLDADMQAEFTARFKPCKYYAEARASCERYCTFTVGGVEYTGISKDSKVYNVKNPTAEQFEWIKKFISARRNYIDTRQTP
jgi:hypothetical protein